jgi:NADPH:quinone reductase
MQYVAYGDGGDASVLHAERTQAPTPRRGEVRIRVEAAGVSQADSMQRQGAYPPPKDASPILGLEVAGTIDEVAAEAGTWRTGDRVCALVNGGGYAEYVTAPHGQVLPIPQGWSAVEAATLPENAFTVYDNMITRARLQAGETVLVHGGTSGIGSTAIMFAKALGADAIATAGSREKCAACLRLGARAAIDYHLEDFVAEVMRLTQGRGVDVILDIVGGEYIQRDLETLALEGRIASISVQRGNVATIDLRALLHKRATLLGSSLRPRTSEQKAAIAERLRERIWPLLPARNPIAPVVDSVFSFDDASLAHERLEASLHVGKIVLVPQRTEPPSV